MNGIARQPIPRPDQTTNQPVTYPFKSYDGKQTVLRDPSGAGRSVGVATTAATRTPAALRALLDLARARD